MACTPGHSDHASHAGEGIVISDARVRPPLPGRTMAAGYFTLSNHGPADKLLSVSSPVSDRVELHTHLKEDGIMKMRRVDGVELPAGKDVVFKPGGYHVMFFGSTITPEDTDISLTLTFETADPVTLIAEINETPQETSHSGH